MNLYAVANAAAFSFRAAPRRGSACPGESLRDFFVQQRIDFGFKLAMFVGVQIARTRAV